MTLPVPVFRNANILNTRRTIGGVYRLCPNPVIKQITLFALAYAAQKHNVSVFAHISLSNHQHTAFFDRDGNHPEFRRDLHSLTSRAVNRHRGMTEAMWAPHHKSPVLLYDLEALLDEIAYTIANACLHDLVDKPEDWPGAISLVADLAGPGMVIRRPDGFFDPHGKVPEEIVLRFEKPPAAANMTDEEYRVEISRRVDEKCRAARRSRQRRGIKVLGRAAILDQSPAGAPMSQPVPGTLNPIVACSRVAVRIAFLLWLRVFRDRYEQSRRAFERGESDIEFPFATYLYARRYGVNCSSVGPPVLPLA